MGMYDAVLSPLGFVSVWTAKDAAGYGQPDRDHSFAIRHDAAAPAPNGLAHVAGRNQRAGHLGSDGHMYSTAA
jgi:hypothetical protein